MTATEPMDIAIVGVGKIARDQHLPAIAGDPAFHLAATVSRSGGIEGVETHADIDTFLAARPDVPAVSLCMPPLPRFEAARAAIAAGRHTMLEKPPGATLSEVFQLRDMAREAGVTLFATWHSRHAAGVEAARDWLAGRTIRRLRTLWKEDARKWHPGQEWIWQAGGLGVFDPGINALSILTRILPAPIRLAEATLTFPENRETPIAADLTFAAPFEATAAFDWRQEGGEIWQIEVETDAGTLRLVDGGARLRIDGEDVPVSNAGEYPELYRRFADLIAAGDSDVDAAPLMLVADAFLLGRRVQTDPFHF